MDLHGLTTTGKTRINYNLYLKDSIQECLETYQASLETLQYCIQQGGDRYADPQLLKILQSCAEVTLASARLMLLQSPYHAQLCAVSALICMECAKSCEEFEDSILQDCAEICRDCADACQRMAA